MDNLINQNGKMSSLEIAKLTGLYHEDLLLDILNMEETWEKIGQGKFEMTSYTDKYNRKKRMYLLNKAECLYIVIKFNNEARAKFVMHLKELEESPKTKAFFANFVGHSKNSILIGQFAKKLYNKGIKIGQNQLFSWLCTRGYLMITGDLRNYPTKEYINQGYFEVSEQTIQNPDGESRTVFKTCITGKGQVKIFEKLRDELLEDKFGDMRKYEGIEFKIPKN